MVCKRIFVFGKVQGVGFRYHTLEMAQSLDLKGWVRNLNDGRVEILAFGPLEQIKIFIQWVHRGPDRAVVERVLIEDGGDQPTESFFIDKERG